MKLSLILHTDALRIEIVAGYSAGRPARMYLSNGDPGYPEDPPECWLESYEAWLSTELTDPLPKTSDDVRVESDGLRRMVEAWLDSEEGQEAVAEAVAADREYAEEQRAEQRRGRWAEV